MTGVGALFRPQVPPEKLRECVTAAEEAGLDELWLFEDCFYQTGIGSAAFALAWTERLRVSVGVVPAPMRNVAMTAMEAATLLRTSGGRFTLGVGHGGQDWMAQAGVKPVSPLTFLREYLTALRALLHGENVTQDGRYVSLTGVRLEWPPADPPPILVGAMGPQSMRLSGELADGTIVGLPDPDLVASARKLVDEGRARAGRTDHHRLIVSVSAPTGPGSTDRLRAELAAFGAKMPEQYANGVTPESSVKLIRALVDAGADDVIVGTTADDPDPAGFIRYVAGELRPAVQ
ncbi:LLM class flavin-dependent oxidoreductase [Amycolatopsis jejuensis]|uniref:LLM class flavin-dependent oxidoreductase n=1 Tax=Amycolatopsis jejuensis TaxID=330084 RepID=UPI000524004D|nr:LLM class flavin-dependent oxidoreductase [Amycolatopsis jejuensis]